MQLSREEQSSLSSIVMGSALLQPTFPEPIAQRLLELSLVRQTLGGTLKATEKGRLFLASGFRT